MRTGDSSLLYLIDGASIEGVGDLGRLVLDPSTPTTYEDTTIIFYQRGTHEGDRPDHHIEGAYFYGANGEWGKLNSGTTSMIAGSRYWRKNASIVPAENVNGVFSFTTTVVADITGGIEHRASCESNEITIIPVNDAPTAVDRIATVDQDVPTQLLDAEGWAGAFQDTIDEGDDDHDDPFELIIGDTSDLHGTLTLDGFAVVSGDTVAWDDLPDLLYQKSDPNYNGEASFGFKVRDAGGVDNGGVDTSLNTATMTINPVNDAPTIDPSGLTALETNEDTDFTFSFSDDADGSVVADVDAHQGNNELEVTLSVLSGSLNLGTSTGLTVSGDWGRPP